MDISDDSSRGESQASQLLRAVLPHGLPFPIANVGRATNRTQGGICELSVSQGTRDSVSQYSFHELAATQLDLQAQDQHRVGSLGGEREKAGVLERATGKSAWPTEALSEVRAPILNDRILFADRVVTSAFKSSKAVSFHSPLLAPPAGVVNTSVAPTRTMHRARRQRSPSPASQDSFAGPLSCQDPQKLFLQNARNFNMPLEELARPRLLVDDVSDATAETSSSLYASANPHALSPRSCRVAPPLTALPRHGEVLVVSTPSISSQSGSSQILSQAFGSRQPDNYSQLSEQYISGQARHVDLSDDHHDRQDGQNFGAATIPSSPQDDISTEPSSSYERLLGQDPFQPIPESLVATQPATQQGETEPTQPLDPSIYAGPSTSGNTHGVTYIDRQYPVPSTPMVSEAASKMSVPIGMLSLIPAHKRHRYQGVPVDQSDTSGTQGVPGPSTNEPTQVTAPQDTQASDAFAVHGSAETQFRDPEMMPPPPPPPRRRQLPSRPRPRDDNEVVPDSEPTEVREGSPSKPSATHAQTPSLADINGEDAASGSAVNREDSLDEEDDIPLAAALQTNVQGKGKQKADSIVMSRVPSTLSPRTDTTPRKLIFEQSAPSAGTSRGIKRHGLPKPVKRRTTRGRSPEIDEIPSSEPVQDTFKTIAARISKPAATKKEKDVILARSLKKEVKSRSATPVAPKRLRRAVPEEEEESSDDETAVSKDVAAMVLDEDAEVDTELADDDYMDVDETEEILPRPVPPRKRKRAASVTLTKSASKANRAQAQAPTPLNRAAKKLKMSSTLGDDVPPTRVYALWKQDGHYYAGTVHSLVSTSPARYLIQFDDGTEDVIDLSRLRLCQLTIGDNVLLVADGQRAKVVDNAHLDTERIVTVEIDNGDELDRMEVEVQYIRIASRTLISAWRDRTLTTGDIVPIVRPKQAKVTPSLSKSTIASAGSVKGSRRLLAKTGLVVTLSPGNHNWSKDKDRLMSSIKSTGGTVIDDWLDIFSMEGTHSQGNKRWVIRQDDIQWRERDDVERVFLLSDDSNQKPKFLIALALGIPCLSIEWLQQTVGARAEQDWSKFLLPAGFSDPLNARVSQMVDLDWGNSTEHLTDILSNTVASKLFTDKSILCIAPDFLPAPMKTSRRNGDSDKAKESTRMVPRIILCMGAARVEAIPDLKYASTELSKFDYVVVKECADVDRVSAHANCVHFGWVKDCLIAGRLLPLPEY